MRIRIKKKKSRLVLYAKLVDLRQWIKGDVPEGIFSSWVAANRKVPALPDITRIYKLDRQFRLFVDCVMCKPAKDALYFRILAHYAMA